MGASSSSSRVLIGILAAAVAVLLLILWQQRGALTRIEEENRQLLARTQAPEAVPAAPEAPPRPTETAPATPLAEPESAPAREAPSPVQEQAAKPSPVAPMVATPTGLAPQPRSTGLSLAGTHAAPVEGGLRATMRFNPTTTEPLGVVALVARLPRNSDARILDLNPAGSMNFSDVAKRVSEDGKFAFFQGTAASAEAIEFALSVSGAAVADVRGTCGIGPLDLRIDPAGASASPK
jgi:hypothetical protein